MDQVQAEPAEDQLLAEAGLAPLDLPRGFGSLPSIAFGHSTGLGRSRPERIRAFALGAVTDNGYLARLIEKPSDADVKVTPFPAW